MRKNYEKPFLDHNIKKFNLMTIDDINIFFPPKF